MWRHLVAVMTQPLPGAHWDSYRFLFRVNLAIMTPTVIAIIAHSKEAAFIQTTQWLLFSLLVWLPSDCPGRSEHASQLPVLFFIWDHAITPCFPLPPQSHTLNKMVKHSSICQKKKICVVQHLKRAGLVDIPKHVFPYYFKEASHSPSRFMAARAASHPV
jgi:hypothetical protein